MVHPFPMLIITLPHGKETVVGTNGLGDCVTGEAVGTCTPRQRNRQGSLLPYVCGALGPGNKVARLTLGDISRGPRDL